MNMKSGVSMLLVIVLITACALQPGPVEANPLAPFDTDVCSVLAHPEVFAGREVTMRGFVFLGEDHMNVSDHRCPGKGIELVIEDEHTFNQPDIQAFYKTLNHFGRQGTVTLTGLFTITTDQLTPNVLHVHHARDESRAK
jgi:hypothetical protein